MRKTYSAKRVGRAVASRGVRAALRAPALAALLLLGGCRSIDFGHMAWVAAKFTAQVLFGTVCITAGIVAGFLAVAVPGLVAFGAVRWAVERFKPTAPAKPGGQR